MRRRLCLPALLLPLCLSPSVWAGEGAAGLQWLAGDLPPFAWQAAEGPRGFAHDLAVAMAERLGRPAEVHYYPWARAVRQTEQGPAFGVFPLARTPEREARFRWLVPLMDVRYAFVSLKAPRPLEMDALRKLPVGVLRGSPIIDNLRAERFGTIIEGKDYRELLRMLGQGTIRVIYAGAPMLDAAIETYGQSRAEFTTHRTLGEATLYMAASPQMPVEEGEHWVKAYQALEADGTVARLRQRYLR